MFQKIIPKKIPIGSDSRNNSAININKKTHLKNEYYISSDHKICSSMGKAIPIKRAEAKGNFRP